MNLDKEKLREILLASDDITRAGNSSSAADTNHLRDEDFMRLIESGSSSEVNSSTGNGKHSNATANGSDKLSSIRQHLINCDSCLAEFKDFYAFFAPAESNESIADKSEIAAAWQQFTPRIAEKKSRFNFWSWLFPAERKLNYSAALAWGLAAVLLIFTGISFFAWRQATSEKNQLAEQLENQKQSSEERLKSIEQSERNSVLAQQETDSLAAEKTELQKQIAQLQTEIAREKEQRQISENNLSHNSNLLAQTKKPADNSLVNVNTLIYDVFPSDSTVRGSNGNSSNQLSVPSGARNIVLILNAAGQQDFPSYRADLLNSSGKIIWRGAGLKKDNQGNFTITLSNNALKAGNYRVKLTSGAQTVAEYSITIKTN